MLFLPRGSVCLIVGETGLLLTCLRGTIDGYVTAIVFIGYPGSMVRNPFFVAGYCLSIRLPVMYCSYLIVRTISLPRKPKVIMRFGIIVHVMLALGISFLTC